MNARQREVLVKITACEPGRELACSECGSIGQASCDCAAPYVRVAAALADEANRHRSNRAIAKDLGIDHKTVGAARKTGGEHSPPEKVVGLDGKSYPTTRQISPKMQRKLEVHGWYQRAEEAAQYARYASLESCPADKKMKRLAEDVIKAWTDVLNNLKGA